MYFKDDPQLAAVGLAPPVPVLDPLPTGPLGAMARTYNRLGGLIDAVAQTTQIDPFAVLAVWYVESGRLPFIPNRAVLRFENHKFYTHWGKAHPMLFDQHFQFGGRANVPGRVFENHRFRSVAGQNWQAFHGTQAGEYDVFDFAVGLAGEEAASLASSFGGPQILGSNFSICGYASARDLRLAFNGDERWQVLGFYDFCDSNNILRLVRSHRWKDFAAAYNGNANREVYGTRIANAFSLRARFYALPR